MPSLSEIKLPRDLDAEESVLCCLMQEGDHAREILEVCDERHFHGSDFKTIFKELKYLVQCKKPHDLVYLTQHLHDAGLLDGSNIDSWTGVTASGLATLATKDVPTPTYWKRYYERLEATRYRREMVSVLYQSVEDVLDPYTEIAELKPKIERSVIGVDIASLESKDFVDNGPALMDAVDYIESMAQNKGGTMGLPSGFPQLDDLTDGLHPGELIIIAARPSVGKSALAMQVINHLAIHDDRRCGVFSLEMSERMMMCRQLSMVGRVDLKSILRNGLTNKDMDSLVEAANKLSKAKLMINFKSGISGGYISTVVRREHRNHPFSCIMVDYLQIMAPISKRGKDSKVLEVSENCQAMKELGKELNIPVILLAQINRDAEKRKETRPKLSDLKDSGQIEQDADQVWLIHRDEEDAEINVAKNRTGPTGIVEMTFIKGHTTFLEKPRTY
jgi:replicative DNA helicase